MLAAALKAPLELGDTLPKTSKSGTRPTLSSNLSPPDSGRLKWCLTFDPQMEDPLPLFTLRVRGKEGKRGRGEERKRGNAERGRGEDAERGRRGEGKRGRGGEGREEEGKRGRGEEGKSGRGEEGERGRGGEGSMGRGEEGKRGREGEGKTERARGKILEARALTSAVVKL